MEPGSNSVEERQQSYLTAGGVGATNGGTTMGGDTGEMIGDYENIFGPAGRDIKTDTQRHKRHQRWHLPDALKGHNQYLTDRIDGLITDATNSPFTRNILPYVYLENPDQKLKWNVYSFDEGIASRVPYESAARVLPQSKRSFAGYAVRQGLAIAMEHNFMVSAAGRENFKNQLNQLVGSIQLTNDLDVHMALLLAPSYQRTMNEKFQDDHKSLSQHCRMYVDMFGILQKIPNAMDILIEDARTTFSTWGSKPPTFCLCNNALTTQLTMNPERTDYVTNGVDGLKRLAAGPDLNSYRGLQIINSRKFSMDAGAVPRDLLRRKVRVAEYYHIPWQDGIESCSFEFYDQGRDTMFVLSWEELLLSSLTQDDDERIREDFLKAGIDESPAHLHHPSHRTPSFYGHGASGYVDGRSSLSHGESVKTPTSHLRTQEDTSREEVSKIPTEDEKAAIPEASHASHKFSTSSHAGLKGPDLFILRPCIEHHMLGVIFGRGGTQELGATFWGQTELSCYDDAQHGIWGMSYKYHERAVVTNERNLTRVFDVAFDGYTGGMGQRKLDWKKQDTERGNASEAYKNSCTDMKNAVENRLDPYDGPDMIVMHLHANRAMGEWPNPLLWTQETGTLVDPESGKVVHGLEQNQLKNYLEDTGKTRLSRYNELLGIHTWCQHDQANLSGGAAAVGGESTQPCMAFQGSMRRICGTQSHYGALNSHPIAPMETRGSGHLGHSFVGCASVREGRGMVHTGAAQRMHLS
jgi:hypothetical protein